MERQRWDNGGIAAQKAWRTEASTQQFSSRTNENALWFDRVCNEGKLERAIRDSAFGDTKSGRGVIELKALTSSQLTELTLDVIRTETAKEPQHSRDAIWEQLRKIDTSGRPLYAYFLGKVLSESPNDQVSTREQLLGEVINNDWKNRWPDEFDESPPPVVGEDTPAMHLAVLANILGGMMVNELDRGGANLRLLKDVTTRKQALVLNDGTRSNTAMGPGPILPSLLPDLLGEWLVVSAMRNGLETEVIALLEMAWKIRPDDTATFLLRLAQDFPGYAETNQLLATKPPSQDAIRALQGKAASIVAALMEANPKIPKPLFEALKSAAESDLTSLELLGVCYYFGFGTPVEYEQAFKCFDKGVRSYTRHERSASVTANLGVCFTKGIGVKRDHQRAAQLYREAANAGDVRAMVNLGLSYQNGIGVKKDHRRAVQLYQAAANAGDLVAINNLGLCYANGFGLEKDVALAVQLYRQAADAKNVEGIINLAWCYLIGRGVEMDESRAADLFQQAALAGNASAIVDLGICYVEGKGVEKDAKKAVALFQLAAEFGHVGGIFNLGLCYANGVGVEEDKVKAEEFFRVAQDDEA